MRFILPLIRLDVVDPFCLATAALTCHSPVSTVLPYSCYAQVVGLVRALFQRAGLVHGDLSEYNILWHQSRPFLIDFGQSVHFGHPKSNE